MKHPARSLLSELFVLPVLRVLQRLVDIISGASNAVRSEFNRKHNRSMGIDMVANSRTPPESRSSWQGQDIVGPIYNLASKGLSNRAIAVRLNVTEVAVHGCIGWLVRILRCDTRAELVLYASDPLPGPKSLRDMPSIMITSFRRWRQRRLLRSLLAR